MQVGTPVQYCVSAPSGGGAGVYAPGIVAQNVNGVPDGTPQIVIYWDFNGHWLNASNPTNDDTGMTTNSWAHLAIIDSTGQLGTLGST